MPQRQEEGRQEGAAKPAESAADKKADERKEERRVAPPRSRTRCPARGRREGRARGQEARRGDRGLKRIIPKIEDGSPQKAELLFQLSELYWEKSKYLYRQEMRKFQEDEKKVDEARNRARRSPTPKEDHRESELYRAETMRLYETILRDYPAYERKDEVLFSLGYNLYEIGKKDRGGQALRGADQELPESQVRPRHLRPARQPLLRRQQADAKAQGDTTRRRVRSSKSRRSTSTRSTSWPGATSTPASYEKALKKLQEVVDYAEKQRRRS